MKFLVVFALFIAATLAAPPTADITILKNAFESELTGYNFAYVEIKKYLHENGLRFLSARGSN